MNIKIYELTQDAERQYRDGALHYNNLDINTLKRRLSAIIYAASSKQIHDYNIWTAKFGSFIIEYKPYSNLILTVRWVIEKQSLWYENRFNNQKLKRAYKQLGLSSMGV